MLKKILVAFDGSENSFKAFKRAIALAREHECELGLATVVSLPGLSRDERISRDHLSGKRTPFQKDLERAAMIALQEDIPVTTHLLRGQSAKSLAQFCEKYNYDLVFAGLRGKNSRKECAIGSFASQLVNLLGSKVTLVKDDEKAGVKTA